MQFTATRLLPIERSFKTDSLGILWTSRIAFPLQQPLVQCNTCTRFSAAVIFHHQLK